MMKPPEPLEALAAELRRWIERTVSGNPSTTDGEAEFEDFARRLFRLQAERVPAYGRLCAARGVHPGNLRRWADVPALPTAAFKELEITSLSPEARTNVFHSSGTTEVTPSRHFHSPGSLALYEAVVLAWFQPHALPELGEPSPPDAATELTDPSTPAPIRATGQRFLALTPAPACAPHSSLVHMFASVIRRFGDTGSGFFAHPEAASAWALESERLVAELDRAERENTPVFLLGTGFSFVHLLDHLGAEGRRVCLPAGSRLLETGGYKGRSRALAKDELHARLRDRLTVAPDHLLCEYGMSELSSQAYDGVVGRPGPRRFRFPPWARARVISPESGTEVAEGEPGLLRVFDLANVWSVLAVQTEDLAIRRGEGFELLGRAAQAEPRGCSLMPG